MNTLDWLLFQCYGKNRARVRERLISANQELFQLESLCIALDNAVNNLYVAVNLDKGPLSHRVYSWLSLQVCQELLFSAHISYGKGKYLNQTGFFYKICQELLFT